MKRGHWILLTFIAISFLISSVFFFFGSLLSLFNTDLKTGNLAVVEVLGEIFDAKPALELLMDLRKDKEVKAVVLRVDSPGGSVGASQEIFEAVSVLKKEKPVVVSMGSVAASGGYYIAAPATKILANLGTITGSLGVRMEMVNVEELMQWAKLKPVMLKSGKWKDSGSPFRPMTEEEREYLQSILKKLHEQFKQSVASSRGLTLDQINPLAEGQVFTGEEALKNKLIDEIGSLDRAIQVAAELGGIKGEPEVFYPSSSSKKFLERLIDGAVERIWSKILGLSSTQFLY